MSYKMIFRTALSGLSFHSYAMYAKQIDAGEELILVRDPANPHDKNAIKVFYGEEQIGWVPKEKNEILAKMLDEGFDVRCWVIAHDLKAPLVSRLYCGFALKQGA